MKPIHVAIVGCGSAGPAAALYLHRAGHHVQVFERAPELLPVGAGFLLQPTGLAVLDELGLRAAVVDRGAPVSRLLCTTQSGARLLDLHYDELQTGLRGIGVHRATLLAALTQALADDRIPLHLGADVHDITVDQRRAHLHLADGDRRGSFDLVIVADGARSALRTRCAPPHKATRYPWGALWFVGLDEANQYGGQLHQIVSGTRRMAGFLPTGRAPGDNRNLVSLFWSVQLDAVDALRAAGLDAWKQQVLRLAPLAQAIVEQIHDIDQLTLAPYMDVRMKPWNRGPVLFIGDAAHATSPQLGQGVNLALQDARAIAAAVAESVGSAVSGAIANTVSASVPGTGYNATPDAAPDATPGTASNATASAPPNAVAHATANATPDATGNATPHAAPVATGNATLDAASNATRNAAPNAQTAPIDQALARYHQLRRRQLAYYQFTTRALTPFFQSRSRLLGPLRDIAFRAAHPIGPLRRQMLRTMAGVKQGILRRSLPLPPPRLPATNHDE